MEPSCGHIQRFAFWCSLAKEIDDPARAGACAAVAAHEAFNLFPDLRDDTDRERKVGLLGECGLAAFHTRMMVEAGAEEEAAFHARHAARLAFTVFPTTLRGAA